MPPQPPAADGDAPHPTAGPRPRRGVRLVGAAAALALVATVVYMANPATVWRLLRSSDPAAIAGAAAVAAAAAGCRGVRLSLLLPLRVLGPGRATLVATAAQAAAQLLPLRSGELAMPLLLGRSAGLGFAAGVSTLLAARTLDLAALGAWTAAGVLMVWGASQPVALALASSLLVPILLLPFTLAAADWLALRTLGRHGLRGRRWARRVRQMHRAVEAIRRRPARLAGACTASLAMWGAIWAYTWLLLVAMGYRWPVAEVIAGSAFASLANLLPVNLVANLHRLRRAAGGCRSHRPCRAPVGSGVRRCVWGNRVGSDSGRSASSRALSQSPLPVPPPDWTARRPEPVPVNGVPGPPAAPRAPRAASWSCDAAR